MTLLLVVPSRGRPEKAALVREAFFDTKGDAETELIFVLDDDDPTRGEYPVQQWVVSARGNMNAALQEFVKSGFFLDEPGVTVVGFAGDDHLPRTQGWDTAILDLLAAHPGVAYANDLFQGEKLCTNWMMSRPIFDEFGFGLKTVRHLYMDNYWMALAGGAGCLFYLPDVVIEHMHYQAGKSVEDAGYLRVNSPQMYEHDAEQFGHWIDGHREQDIERLKRIVG
jgi:hypothetical protein